jgi:hypothetical protein
MLIAGGTVVTGDGVSVVSGGYVHIRDGRIVEVGAGAAPADDDIIDASGQVKAELNAGQQGNIGGAAFTELRDRIHDMLFAEHVEAGA